MREEQSCPCCGSYRKCYCTYDEIIREIERRRKREEECRKKNVKPAVIERQEYQLDSAWRKFQ